MRNKAVEITAGDGPPLPSGTVTFLFTDIEGSTRLWETHPVPMRAALARHDALLGACIAARGGHVFKTVGDAFCAAFASAPDAVEAALAAQRALLDEPWPAPLGAIRARAALHTGLPEARGGDYFGPPLNRVARLLSLGHGGQTLLSAATYELVRDGLPDGIALRDLGPHRMRDLARAENVYQLLAPDLPGEFPPLKSLEALPHNLPVQLTSFVGREREIAEVEALVTTGGHRLVTLTGAGGAGKTRLSLQVGAELLEAFPDGVWLVELAPLLPTIDEATVAETVGRAVGVREEPGTPMLTTLARALKEKRLLVLLDNCEHLVAVCARLAGTLLHACPPLHLLATSREPLGVLGETVYRVPSLAVPYAPGAPRYAPGAATPASMTPESLSQFEAVRLFVDRAAAAKPDFAVTNQNAPHVAELCWRLDGIPLALELAAARVRSLPVEEINARLDHRFRLLTGGNRAALPRQQTLRATVDWSYALLTESERLLLCRLSVFAGRWTLESAEAVCGFDPLQDWEVVDLLSSLVEKSLAQFDAEAGRYSLLETIRQYGHERLAEADPAILYALRCRHRDRVRQGAGELWDLFMANDWQEISRRFSPELDDVRAAVAFCLEDAESPESAEAAAWILARGRNGFFQAAIIRECGEWMERARGHPAFDAESHAAAWLINSHGLILDLLGRTEDGRACLTGAAERHVRHGDRLGESDARFWLAWACVQLEDYETARAECTRACELSHELGESVWEATHWNGLGMIAQETGDLDEALRCFGNALALFRAAGDANEATALENAAYVYVLAGRLEEARAHLAGAYRAYFRDGPHSTEVVNHLNFCDTAGALACAAGEYTLSARCYALSEAAREETGFVRERYIQRAADRAAAATVAALGPAAYAAERARALQVPLDAFLRSLGDWLGAGPTASAP